MSDSTQQSPTSPTRRAIAQQWISADGFVAGTKDDEMDVFAAVEDSSDSERHNLAMLESVDFVLLGRRTYESFVQFWPTADEEPMAVSVNAVPKVVCSTTLSEAPWGTHAAAEVVADGVEHVRRLRSEPGGDVLVWGSIDLMRSLLRAGVLDEIELFVAPIALGSGTPLLAPDGPYGLTRTGGDLWPSGVVRLRYAVNPVSPGH